MRSPPRRCGRAHRGRRRSSAVRWRRWSGRAPPAATPAPARRRSGERCTASSAPRSPLRQSPPRLELARSRRAAPLGSVDKRLAEVDMALVVITIPPGIDEDMYDAVNAKLGDEMPEGLLVHSSGRNESGELQIVDVWESQETHDRFTEGRLWDAIKAVASERGMDAEQAPPPRRTMYETHSLMVRQPQHA